MIGREKCKLLKRIRAKIAADNGIKGFEYKPCLSVGECRGTCPACDAEALELQRILQEKGVDVNVPRDPNMPKDLIGVMDDNVYQDMQTIAERYVYSWDYDDVEVGRMLTRKAYSEMPDSEQHYKYPKVVVRPGCTVGMITPYRDWDELDEEAVNRKNNRTDKRKNPPVKKNIEPENNDNDSEIKKRSWFVANQSNGDITSESSNNNNDVLEQMQVIKPTSTNQKSSKKRRRKERPLAGNVTIRTSHTHKDKSRKIPRGLLNLFTKKDGDKK